MIHYESEGMLPGDLGAVELHQLSYQGWAMEHIKRASQGTEF